MGSIVVAQSCHGVSEAYHPGFASSSLSISSAAGVRGNAPKSACNRRRVQYAQYNELYEREPPSILRYSPHQFVRGGIHRHSRVHPPG
jgi:hypothetical protein